MLDAGLYALLDANKVTIGASFYPGELPQQVTAPVGTYTEIVHVPEPTLDTSGFQRARYQFDCYGDTPIQAATLRESLRNFLNGYSGQLTDADQTFLEDVQLCDQSGAKFDADRRKFYCIVEFYLLFDFS